MISEIRDYIRGIVLSIDPEFKENESAFLDNDIGESLLDRSYQITINGLVVTTRNYHYDRQMSVQVTFFGFGYRDQVRNFDILLEKAICIEDKIISLKNFSGIETITNISSDGIEVSKYPDADDCFKIDINLTLTQAYSRE